MIFHFEHNPFLTISADSFFKKQIKLGIILAVRISRPCGQIGQIIPPNWATFNHVGQISCFFQPNLATQNKTRHPRVGCRFFPHLPGEQIREWLGALAQTQTTKQKCIIQRYAIYRFLGIRCSWIVRQSIDVSIYINGSLHP